MSDTPHTIFRSAKQFLTGTMLSRITGLLRDIAMAYAFGTHAAVAAFLVAFRLSHLLRRLFGEGALQTAFTPQFEKLKQADPQRACRFFRDLSLLLFVSLSFLILTSMLILGYSYVFGHYSEDNKEIIQLTLIMLPSLLFICLFGLNASLLQCQKNYFIPGIAPVAFNTVWIIGIGCLWSTPPAQAMLYLGGFLNLACFAQWMVTLPKTLAILRSYHLNHYWQGFQFFSTDLQRLVKPLLLGIVGVGAAQINNALDAIFARYASSEGPAYLWYALRIQQLPLALIGIAIAGALLPPLARAIKSNDFVQCNHFLNFSLKRSLAFMLPISVGIFALGEQCVMLLYERGGFDQDSVKYTTQCLWGYGFGLVPMTLVLILAPAFYAQENYRLPTLASLFAMILNIILNYTVIVIFEHNSAGIAWVTSLCAWINFFILGYALRKSLGNFALGCFWPCSGKVLISSLMGLIAVLGLEKGMGPNTSDFIGHLTQFATAAFTYCLATAMTAWIIRSDDLLYLLKVKSVNSTTEI
jgi:putative peptidoglycan lipid II flippase